MLTLVKGSCSSHPDASCPLAPAPLREQEESRTPGDGLLPVEVFLASVTCLFRSPPPGENRWNGDMFSQGKEAAVAHPLTATRSERQWLGTRPPADLRGAYF